MPADQAAGRGAQYPVTVHEMAGDTADDGAFEAARRSGGSGRQCCCREQHARRDDDRFHEILSVASPGSNSGGRCIIRVFAFRSPSRPGK